MLDKLEKLYNDKDSFGGKEDFLERVLKDFPELLRLAKLGQETEQAGNKYYGGDKTIHRSGHLDVETTKGEVVAVWFRCLFLPFKQTEVDEARATAMRGLYPLKYSITGVATKTNE